MSAGRPSRLSRLTRGLEDVAVKSMSPIEGAIKRSGNALGDLNDFLSQLEERISPVLSSSRPEACENDAKVPVSGESGVYNEIEEISNRIWRACARVREISDRVEL
jgi:hypothetical protein